MNIRLIKETEYKTVADLIYRAISNPPFSTFYPQFSIKYLAKALDEKGVKKRASWTHFYVVEIDGEIVGCGAIGPYWDSLTESSLFSIFVDPRFQGQGIGRKIIETLEQDEFFKRADRIEVPASMSAIPFYRKMGYEHKNGELNFHDGEFKLEKFNKK